jgi:hypothetical protein
MGERKGRRGGIREGLGKGGNIGAGCKEQTQNIIACDYCFVKSRMHTNNCRLVKY